MKWVRYFNPMCLPLGEDGRLASGSPKHAALSRAAAAEGAVLLKNETKILPLAKGTKVVLLGKASVEYIKGGGGSGDVTVRCIHNIFEGMKSQEALGKVSVYDGLLDFYTENVKAQHATGREPGMTVEPVLTEEQLTAAAEYSDTAVVCICRFSGEGWDRKCTDDSKIDKDALEGAWETENAAKDSGDNLFYRGDFYLSENEEALFAAAKRHFKHIVVVLNVGGMVDTQWFKEDPAAEAVLFAGQGGMEGGMAVADLLVGDVNPSGKLTDTFAKDLSDYPSSAGFHDSVEYVEYNEDIYVGYRYFETIPGAAEKVNYPFGFGLSYTTFSKAVEEAAIENGVLTVKVAVTNTGSYAGKEVIQLYYEAPQGKLGKPKRVLGAFAKTKLLDPGETGTVVLSMAVNSMASYDDLGKVQKSAWVLEQGEYKFHLGTSVRDTEVLDLPYVLSEDVVTEQLTAKIQPRKLPRRMLADGTYEELPVSEYDPIERPAEFDNPEGLEAVVPESRLSPRMSLFDLFQPKVPQLRDVAEGRMTLDSFLDVLTTEELVRLCGGQVNTGVANTWGMGNDFVHGIPNVMTADGPAGLRIGGGLGVYTTAWPCATILASTWNTELVQEVGSAAALEVKENNIGIWLAPGMNIHRSPLCGRNFEYYSEDPLVAGMMGCAIVKGVQSRKIAATPKHFACNNKETNRKHSDSRVSERAAREIYLKGFEIVVKDADPWVIMSSYNIVNGTYASENRELLTGILREQWGFNGIVTTDWWTRAEHWREIKAGNDVKMANGYPEQVLAALEEGKLEISDVRACAKRVLEMILKHD